MARILRREQAILDMMDIWRYVAQYSGPERAGAVIRQLEQKIQTIAEFPHMGRRRDDLVPGLRSVPFTTYVLCYFPLDDGIEVVRVVDGRRDLPAVFAYEDE
jgi:toxin ParE1/3/4